MLFYFLFPPKQKGMRRLTNTRGETEINDFERRMPPPPIAATPKAPNSHAASIMNKNFVLYVKPNDRPSQIAYELATPLFDIVHIQDVKAIPPGELPPFLKGVPTLVNVKKLEAYPGKRCLVELELLLDHFSPTGTPAHEFEGTMIAADPFTTPRTDSLDPQGVDSGVMGKYAACDITSSDCSQYQSGRRKREDMEGVINKLLQERTSIEAPRGEPSASEMSKILASMQESA